MKYPIIKKPDQDTTVKLGKTVYRAYSGKKLKGLYPDDNYTVVGEVKPGSNKKQVGEFVSNVKSPTHNTCSQPVTENTVFSCNIF